MFVYQQKNILSAACSLKMYCSNSEPPNLLWLHQRRISVSTLRWKQHYDLFSNYKQWQTTLQSFHWATRKRVFSEVSSTSSFWAPLIIVCFKSCAFLFFFFFFFFFFKKFFINVKCCLFIFLCKLHASISWNCGLLP